MDSNNEVCNIDAKGPGRLVLRSYQIWGVPTSGGVPDDHYYSLTFEGLKVLYPSVNKHNLGGFSLMLLGSNTDKSYDTSLYPPVADVTSTGNIKQATLRLTSPSTNNPTFTKAQFTFVYIPN